MFFIFITVNKNAQLLPKNSAINNGERKRWIHDPTSDLCRPLNCKKREICLLENEYSAVCVSKKELHKNRDVIITKSKYIEEQAKHRANQHINKNNNMNNEDEDDDEDDEEEDDENNNSNVDDIEDTISDDKNLGNNNNDEIESKEDDVFYESNPDMDNKNSDNNNNNNNHNNDDEEEEDPLPLGIAFNRKTISRYVCKILNTLKVKVNKQHHQQSQTHT
uniref:Uncharacterized protein n=1 Tax=Glossina pallidipes TaxID=7398 RepID=A0A1A9ZN35_GLOPL